MQRAEKSDGKFVVHSNDDTLSTEDMALGYEQLMRERISGSPIIARSEAIFMSQT